MSPFARYTHAALVSLVVTGVFGYMGAQPPHHARIGA